MSKRGADFLQKWLSNNIPASGTVSPDDLSVAELAQKLFADAGNRRAIRQRFRVHSSHPHARLQATRLMIFR